MDQWLIFVLGAWIGAVVMWLFLGLFLIDWKAEIEKLRRCIRDILKEIGADKMGDMLLIFALGAFIGAMVLVMVWCIRGR